MDFPGAVEGAGEVTRNADADYCYGWTGGRP